MIVRAPAEDLCAMFEIDKAVIFYVNRFAAYFRNEECDDERCGGSDHDHVRRS